MSIFSGKIISNNLLKENRKEIIQKISTALKAFTEVEKAYLFGSYANATHTNDSDIDLLIVAKTNLPFTQRNGQYSSLLDIFSPIDILVYTNEEFENLMKEEQGFWKKFRENHLQIF